MTAKRGIAFDDELLARGLQRAAEDPRFASFSHLVTYAVYRLLDELDEESDATDKPLLRRR